MANDFVIRISADDKATAVVKKIQAALGKITEPVEKANKRVSSLGDVGTAGLAKLRKGMDGVANSASKVVDKIVEIIPGLTAIGGAASIAGLSALAVKFGNLGFSLNKNSKLLGMNAQDLAAWHVAAKRAGISAEEFDSSMAGSQGAIRGAAFGADPHAMMMLQKMGVQIQHNKDGSIDYLSTQQKIMTALAKQPSVQGQRDAANVLGMGALLPMIQQGTYAADKARAMRKGLVPTPEEIARATTFHQNVNDLEDSVTGLGNSIGSRLIPILEPLVRGFSAWLDKNRAQVADAIAGAVQRFAEWIKSINWGDVVAQMKSLFDAMGGIKGIAIALAVITFASPIAGLLSMITSLTTLATTAIPAAVLGFTGLGLAAAAAAAAYTINKIKDSTEPGHFVGRNAGAPIANPLRQEDANQALLDRIVQGAKDLVSTPTGRFVPRNAGPQLPLGIRTNNPLNILTRGSQNSYATPEEGIAAAAANLQKNYRGLSLAGIADKWTGGARTGNSPEQIANYVGILSRGTGLSANQTPDLSNASVVAALLKAQIRAENGQQPYSDAQINAGVNGARGAVRPNELAQSQSSAQARGEAEYWAAKTPADRAATAEALGYTPTKQGSDSNASGQAAAPQINVTVHNALPGTHVEAKSPDGGYFPTKVNYSLRGADGATP